MQTPPPKPLHTLIVDPSRPFSEGVVRWAAERPELVVVGTAASGAEALEAVERLDPELVLVDAVLPEADGFQLVRSIKNRPRAPLAVIVTFAASSALESEARAAGADGFVPKDDFMAAFELLLGDLIASRDTVNNPARPARRESRISRDP